MKIRKQQEELVKRFTKEQNEKLELLMQKQDAYLLDYGVLEIAIEDKLANVSLEETAEFFAAPVEELGNVDVVIARLILTLDKNFPNVKSHYFDKMVLDKSAPEVTYLTNLVKELV